MTKVTSSPTRCPDCGLEADYMREETPEEKRYLCSDCEITWIVRNTGYLDTPYVIEAIEYIEDFDEDDEDDE